jgi:hypothetical protein
MWRVSVTRSSGWVVTCVSVAGTLALTWWLGEKALHLDRGIAQALAGVAALVTLHRPGWSALELFMRSASRWKLLPRRGGAVAPSGAGRSGHVFISYRHESGDGYVTRLASYLAGKGIPVWFDREIISGDRWLEVIRHQVDTCSAVVVVMTPQAEASRWVDRELSRAEEMHRPILPLLRAGGRFFRLADIHYEDVTDGRLPGEEFVERLRTFLPMRPLVPDLPKKPDLVATAISGGRLCRGRIPEGRDTARDARPRPNRPIPRRTTSCIRPEI